MGILDIRSDGYRWPKDETEETGNPEESEGGTMLHYRIHCVLSLL